MNRHILLVNPWIHDFAAYDFWYKPLGLLYIASILRVNGFQISWIDCLDPWHPELHQETHVRMPRIKISGEGSYASEIIHKPAPLKSITRNYRRYGITPRMFLNALHRLPKPDVILVTSMMTYWYTGVFETIKYLKKFYPGVPVVLGGHYATLCPSHSKCSGADFSLPGPAERSLPTLLKNLLGVDMTFMPDVHDLDAYPYPALDLIRRHDSIPLMTSRGCPYRCSYCASHLLMDRFCRRNPNRVADEIEYWHHRFETKNFAFYDDALLVNPGEMIIPLLQEIITRCLPIQFHCPNGLHLKEITPEISSLLFRSGFRTIRFGYETSDAARQQNTGGKVNNLHLREAVLCLTSVGYRPQDIGIYILCGLPGQHADEVRDSIRFVRSLGTRPFLAEYSPIPGSNLWRDAVASSRYPIDEEPLFQNNTLLPCRSSSLDEQTYRELKALTKVPPEVEDP